MCSTNISKEQLRCLSLTHFTGPVISALEKIKVDISIYPHKCTEKF